MLGQLFTPNNLHCGLRVVTKITALVWFRLCQNVVDQNNFFD